MNLWALSVNGNYHETIFVRPSAKVACAALTNSTTAVRTKYLRSERRAYRPNVPLPNGKMGTRHPLNLSTSAQATPMARRNRRVCRWNRLDVTFLNRFPHQNVSVGL